MLHPMKRKCMNTNYASLNMRKDTLKYSYKGIYNVILSLYEKKGTKQR